MQVNLIESVGDWLIYVAFSRLHSPNEEIALPVMVLPCGVLPGEGLWRTRVETRVEDSGGSGVTSADSETPMLQFARFKWPHLSLILTSTNNIELAPPPLRYTK